MRLVIVFFGRVLLIALIISLTSCVHYYYAPNAHNVPLFKEKGETNIIAAISGGEEFSGIEVQFASAVTENIGVMANFITASGGDDEYGSGKGFLFELGAGYYKPLGQKFVFETYGGAGFGSVKNEYSSGDSKAKFTRLFIQPNIGFKTRGFEVAFSTRFAGLNYHSVNYSRLEESYDLDDLEFIKNNKFSFLFEPSLTIRGGWEGFKVQLQYVLSENLNNKNLAQEVSNFNIGMFIDISPKKRISPN